MLCTKGTYSTPVHKHRMKPVLSNVSQSYNRGQNILRKFTKHENIDINLYVSKQRVKTVSHTPPPPNNVALGCNSSFNIE